MKETFVCDDCGNEYGFNVLPLAVADDGATRCANCTTAHRKPSDPLTLVDDDLCWGCANVVRTFGSAVAYCREGWPEGLRQATPGLEADGDIITSCPEYVES